MSNLCRLATLLAIVGLVMSAAPADAQAQSDTPSRSVVEDSGENSADGSIVDSASENQQNSADAELPPAKTHYLGRKIAPTMGYQGAGWLTRKTRQKEEDCATLLRQLRLKPGMTVCDMGCGNGFYTLLMARKVRPRGRVLAVDIQPQMLRLLQARAGRARLTNIKPILSGLADPKLPANKLDLILMVDVYHEFSHPARMLQAMKRSLAPGGVIALAEYREEDPDVPILPLHKMSKQQILKEYQANGLKLVREFDGLPWQHLMFFAREGDNITAAAGRETSAQQRDDEPTKSPQPQSQSQSQPCG